MTRLIPALILAAVLFGAQLTETAWSKVNHHRVAHDCGSC